MHSLDEPMGFGKYATKTLRDVIDTAPSYVGWCVESLEGFVMTDGAFKYFRERSAGEFTPAEWYNMADINSSMLNEGRGMSAADNCPYVYPEPEYRRLRNYYEEHPWLADDYLDDDDGVNWSCYNSDLDLDQQSEDFWN